MKKKSIALVIEYTLLTFVSLLLIFSSFEFIKGSLNKYKEYKKEKELLNFCQDFSFFLKNLNEKGIYYFPYKIKFKDNKAYYNNITICKFSYKFCEKEVKGEFLVFKDKNFICFN
jgi:hypothetical protein